ncbi:hypothetical protein JMN32_15995 [Fulvivirga sp. 29W222]|uniref:DUF7079 domain-containing protein n=1 Tax=Fulvivirga marina TaxID=2494733 RepID=A0A937FZP5_9BACT|nr:hypothetical protein [Fulvivirga marina]MBL6447822.1 hypothetical protein [Fulvivirga marina]
MSIIDDRLPIWVALSEFYLDTELQEQDYHFIYKQMKDSGKSIKELKEIDKYEVFPALQSNLNSVIGEWAGFDEQWLEKVCTDNYRKRKNPIFRLVVSIRNKQYYWMRREHWKVIESMFLEGSPVDQS